MDKTYLGRRLAKFSPGIASKPISKVELLNDTVDGNFSGISYVYSRADKADIQEHASGSGFSFKIKNESPVTWRNGALTAIRPHGAGYGTAGSIVASAVYGVTSTTWMDPVRIDAFYALDGPVLPPYHQEVTLGGRTMIRIASNIAVEK